MNIKKKWNINGFDAVIGNPPYNKSNSIGTGNSIWQIFTLNAINKWITKFGYLLFIHPCGWRKPYSEKSKFNTMFNLMRQIKTN